MAIDFPEDELLHFGVKGMRWGVRKDRETSGGDRTARKETKRQEKSAKYKAKAAAYQKEIQQLNALRPRTPYGRRALNNQREELLAKQRRALDDAERAAQGKLTSRQKKVIVGGVVVGAVVAASVGYSTVQSGEGNRLIMNAKEFLGKEGGTFKKNDFLKTDFTPDALMEVVVKPINPDFDKPGMGSKMNCRRCTFSYEMRRRGYDVEATKSRSAFGQTIYGLINATDPEQKPHKASGKIATVARVIKDIKRGQKGETSRSIKMINNGDMMQGEHRIFGKATGDSKKSQMVFDALSKQPNGSRGEVGILWSHGGGHSIIYEIVRGKPVIMDGQTGEIFRHAGEFEHLARRSSTIDFTRLDNKDLDMEFLKRWAKNA